MGDIVGALTPYLPFMAGGFSGLQMLMSYLANAQREKQMKEMWSYYTDPGKVTGRASQYFDWMQPAVRNTLSQYLGDAGAKGWSGYPQGLAMVTANAMAPYQQSALQMAMGMPGQAAQFMSPQAQATGNPIEAFLRATMMNKAFAETPRTESPTAGAGWSAEPQPGFSLGVPGMTPPFMGEE